MALDRVDRLKREFDIEVEWKGWEIHPEFPAEGMPRSAFGARGRAVSDSVRQLADEVGMVVNSPDPLSNTHLALVASELARDAGAFEHFHRRTFEAYFRDQKNIGDIAVLREIAVEAGLDPMALEAALATRQREDRLRETRREIEELGATGVPTFKIGEIWITGVMPIEMLRRMLRRAGAAERG